MEEPQFPLEMQKYTYIDLRENYVLQNKPRQTKKERKRETTD